MLSQAFRVVRRPNGNVIIASDGLSDPFDDISLGEPGNSLPCTSVPGHKAGGFGCMSESWSQPQQHSGSSAPLMLPHYCMAVHA